MKAVLVKIMFGLISGISVAAGSCLWENVLKPGTDKLVAKIKEANETRKLKKAESN